MKRHNLIASIMTALCILGCSKDGGSSAKAKGIVPATAAEIAASPDFKLEHTTPSGVKCYIKEITPDVARSIADSSRDHHFLEDRQHPYLFVIVCNDKIVDWKEISAENPILTPQQSTEVLSWGMQRGASADKEKVQQEVQEMLKKAGKQ